MKEESLLESKLTKDYKFYQELKMKLGQLDQTLQIKDAKNITKWDVDLLNGELFLKLKMDVQVNKLFKKMLGDQLDMLLFVKPMVLYQLLNQKSYLMDHIVLNIVNKSLKKLTQLFSKLYLKIKSSLKECF